MNKKVVIVTGELSGETHGAHLVSAICALSPLEFSGMGSKVLAAAGVRVIYDYRDISIIGISEVFSKLSHIRRAFHVLKAHLVATAPQLLILVDFPGFNLRVARMARRLGIPVVYFIPPQIWAWHRGRIRQIKARVDLVLSILPFEEPFYRQHGVPVFYVGHPYIQSVRPVHGREQFYAMCDVDAAAPVITVMPGSRQSEARRHMPVLLEVLKRFDRDLGRYTVLVPVADTLKADFFLPFLKDRKNVRLVEGLPHDCLAYSHAALVKSGSATLEAAILGVPSVVFYKTSVLTYLAARLVLKVRHISLPNVIAGKEVFAEFIQSIDPERVAKTMVSMLNKDGPAVQKELEWIRQRLTASGPDPYQLAGKEILRFLEHTYGPLPKTT